jgi:hypothetical protein
MRKGSHGQRKEPRKPEPITDPTAKPRTPNRNRRQTMATAVCGHATRATSNEFSGLPKIKPVAGTVAATADANRRTPNASPGGVGLAHTFIAQFFPCDLELNGFRDDGPHFNSLTELETGAAIGYLRGLFKTVRLNDKEAGNCFLGFCKRAVRDHIPARNNFTVMC